MTTIGYEVLWTNRHAPEDLHVGSGPYMPSRSVRSTHRTLRAAWRAVARYRRRTQCTCGCLAVHEVGSDAPPRLHDPGVYE